jgi:hypothetical protein
VYCPSPFLETITVLVGGVSFGALLSLELLMQARLSATVNNRIVEQIVILVAVPLMSFSGYGFSGAGKGE